jgi:VanZ family protein
MRGSPLARLLLLVYVLLVAYASLYPLSGWSDAGLSAFAFLAAPWPRYLTTFDVVVNMLAYVPYGFLCVLALYPRVPGFAAVAVAGLSGAALALALEAAQTYLPARIESNLDVAFNFIGALIGALIGARLAPWLLQAGPLKRLRAGAFSPGAVADLGLVLLGLWLFTQLNPAMLLFGAGDLRDLFAAPGGPARAAELFISIEAMTAGANLVAVAVILSAIAAPEQRERAMLIALVLAALAVKTAAFAILMRAENVFIWLTPGALQGLAAGILAAALALWLPRTPRLVLAAVLLMAGTVLVNLAPPNPYLAASLKVWQQGHFLNFNGLTRLVTSVWPFAALAYIIYLSSRRETIKIFE